MPLTYAWNLAVEQQLTNNVSSRLAYVASHSSHVFTAPELNRTPYSREFGFYKRSPHLSELHHHQHVRYGWKLHIPFVASYATNPLDARTESVIQLHLVQVSG